LTKSSIGAPHPIILIGEFGKPFLISRHHLRQGIILPFASELNEVFVRLNGLLRDDEGKTKKLKELEPPLTWGEVLGYFYYNLQGKKG